MTCIGAQEFIALTQGINSMKEYSDKLNHLVIYTPKINNTEIAWMEKFMYGLDLTIARDVMMGI